MLCCLWKVLFMCCVRGKVLKRGCCFVGGRCCVGCNGGAVLCRGVLYWGLCSVVAVL